MNGGVSMAASLRVGQDAAPNRILG